MTVHGSASRPVRPPLRPGRGVHMVDQATGRLGIVARADPYEDHLTLREPGAARTWDVPYMQIRYATTAESIRIAALEDA